LQIDITLVDRGLDYVDVNIHGKPSRFEILHVCEFNSDRMRMSVLTRGPRGEVSFSPILINDVLNFCAGRLFFGARVLTARCFRF
jgi:magnesium-transporting ATPase (P-type)